MESTTNATNPSFQRGEDLCFGRVPADNDDGDDNGGGGGKTRWVDGAGAGMHGNKLKGRRVRIYWDGEGEWYEAVVKR